MDLSIIIVNWNTRDLLVHCLESVYGTTSDLNFEVIIVDNGSTDGSQALLRDQFPRVRLIQNRENIGFARANNQAVVVSKGRYALLPLDRPLGQREVVSGVRRLYG